MAKYIKCWLLVHLTLVLLCFCAVLLEKSLWSCVKIFKISCKWPITRHCSRSYYYADTENYCSIITDEILFSYTYRPHRLVGLSPKLKFKRPVNLITELGSSSYIKLVHQWHHFANFLRLCYGSASINNQPLTQIQCRSMTITVPFQPKFTDLLNILCYYRDCYGFKIATSSMKRSSTDVNSTPPKKAKLMTSDASASDDGDSSEMCPVAQVNLGQRVTKYYYYMTYIHRGIHSSYNQGSALSLHSK